MSKNSEIDVNLYSRQIAAYGKSAMKSLTNSKIQVLGFNEGALELCKNLILTGISEIHIHSDKVADILDLSYNYYLRETDIGKYVLESIKDELMSLNPYVTVVTSTDSNMKVNPLVDVVILVNHDLEFAQTVNNVCRKNEKKFIWMNSYPLMGNVFCDFGDNFISKNANGEQETSSLLQAITPEGEFICVEGDPLKLEVGDQFTLTGVKSKENATSSELNVNGQTFTVDKTNSNLSFTVKENNFDWSLYANGGRIIEVKQPVSFTFEPLNKSFEEPKIDNAIMVQNLYELHECFRDLQNFYRDNKRLPYTGKDEISVDEKYPLFYNTLQGHFLPTGAVIGSYAAQEAIKAITQKGSPTQQWYYYHCYDMLDKNHKVDPDAEPLVKDRYLGLRYVLGNELVEKIRKQSFFIVGCGAIGCELLKNCAMVGLGTDPNSHITITDPDCIERSNLNRQLLFRNHHIKQNKATRGAIEVQKMNPDINIRAHQNYVGAKTEHVYNLEFYKSITGVANALDNVEARLFMDEKCMFYDKPLFDSGTLGTKGSTQVVIPRLSQPYGAERDPPEKSFAVCTLKTFPNSIQHTIQWAKDKFVEYFTKMPEAWNLYLNDQKSFERKTESQQAEMKYHIVNMYNNRCSTLSECIDLSLKMFFEDYTLGIAKILRSKPKDSVTADGAPFWTGNKKCPHVIHFDRTDSNHLDYVYHTSVLLANLYNVDYDITLVRDIMNIQLADYKEPNLEETMDIEEKVEVTTDEKEQAEKDKLKYSNMYDIELPSPEKMDSLQITATHFEKDDDTNHHIDYITCASNMRALNYDIDTADSLETKFIAGKIIPAIATTTSIVSALQLVEMLKYIFGKDKIEDYSRTSFNLNVPMMFGQFDPTECKKRVFNGKEYTSWDYIDIHRNMFLKDFVDHVSKIFGIEIDTVMYDTAMIISSFTSRAKKEERMNKTLLDILKSEPFNFNINKTSFCFEVTSLDLDDENEDDLPGVRFFNTD